MLAVQERVFEAVSGHSVLQRRFEEAAGSCGPVSVMGQCICPGHHPCVCAMPRELALLRAFIRELWDGSG